MVDFYSISFGEKHKIGFWLSVLESDIEIYVKFYVLKHSCYFKKIIGVFDGESSSEQEF